MESHVYKVVELVGSSPDSVEDAVSAYEKDIILASADQVAIDAVAAKLMGFDPMSLDFIRLAHDAGLGCGDPREIEIVGDTAAANENWRFDGKAEEAMR